MPMTNSKAVARAMDMRAAIGTLSDGLAQYNAAQARHYIVSLSALSLLEKCQFDDLMEATQTALHGWETHHAGMNADGRLKG